jgi:hypothetical protein
MPEDRVSDFWLHTVIAVAMSVFGIAALVLTKGEYDRQAQADDVIGGAAFGLICLLASGLNAWMAWRRRPRRRPRRPLA